MLHHPQGVAEGLLQICLVHQGAAVGQMGGVGNLAGLQGVVAADSVRDGALHAEHGRLGGLLAGHGAQLHAVKGDGGGGGVEHLEDGEHGDRQTGG